MSSSEEEKDIPEEIIAVADDHGFDLEEVYLPRVWKDNLHGQFRVWFSDDGYFSPDSLAVLIQSFFKKFKQDGFWGFEYSFTCSKARPDAWGGGACFVTADDMKFMTTAQWLEEIANKHERRNKEGVE